MITTLLLLLLLWTSTPDPCSTASIDVKLLLERSAGGIGFRARHVGALETVLDPSRISARRQSSLFPYASYVFQRWKKTKNTKNSVATIQSSTATLGQIFGEYYTTVKVGSPGQEAALIIDTGSELTWLQCLPCKSCAPSMDPVFNTARSASYKPVACGNTRLCSNTSQGTFAYCGKDDDQCRFAAFYGDGSFSIGTMATDTLIMEPAAAGAASEVQDFTFGCAQIDFQLLPTRAAGILGLNAGKMALPMQLGQRFGRKFSHCFPDRASHLNSTGMIFFGDAELPLDQIKYTSVVASAASSKLQRKFYHLALRRISIASDDMVDMPHGSLVILDSGSSFTSLSSPIYTRLRDAFLRHRPAILDLVQGSSFGGLDTCFRVSSNHSIEELHQTLPSLSLIFEDGAEIELPSVGILVPVARFPDHFQTCFAFEDGGASDMNIIGNFQQQDLWVEYDMGKSRVGFARANCIIG